MNEWMGIIGFIVGSLTALLVIVVTDWLNRPGRRQ
jgi:hypothetical protein